MESRCSSLPNLSKKAKGVAVVLATCFLAFAPPGTLIFGALLIVALFGKTGLIVAGVSLAAVLLFVLLRYRNSGARPR